MSCLPRLASSTAVLEQLSPILGVLVGVLGTVILVTVFVVVCFRKGKKVSPACGTDQQKGKNVFAGTIFIRHSLDTTTQKQHQKNCGGSSATTHGKGSAEPLSRDILSSHSSLDEKNPDVIPQEPMSDEDFLSEEKAFERLNPEKFIYGQGLNPSTTSTARMDAHSPTHATLQSILNSASLNRQHLLQNKTKVSGHSFTGHLHLPFADIFNHCPSCVLSSCHDSTGNCR